jgi:hypothetical protein
MHNGKAVADSPRPAAKGGQAGKPVAAKTLAHSTACPMRFYQWEAGTTHKYETWFYYGKKRAFAFSGGTLTRKSATGALPTPRVSAGK